VRLPFVRPKPYAKFCPKCGREVERKSHDMRFDPQTGAVVDTAHWVQCPEYDWYPMSGGDNGHYYRSGWPCSIEPFDPDDPYKRERRG
jgi:rRNA maturation protein Nop10